MRWPRPCEPCWVVCRHQAQAEKGLIGSEGDTPTFLATQIGPAVKTFGGTTPPLLGLRTAYIQVSYALNMPVSQPLRSD
jgi:hypothetical protein